MRKDDIEDAIIRMVKETLIDAEKYPGDTIIFSNRAMHNLWQYYHIMQHGRRDYIDSMVQTAFTNIVRRLFKQADEAKILEYRLIFVGRALKYMDQNKKKLDFKIQDSLVKCLLKEVSHEVFVDLALKYIDSR